jgi:hypothetical protein
MRYRNLFASSLMACLLATGLLGAPPAVDPASAGQAGAKAREGSRSYVLESKRRGQRRVRGPRIPLPIGPAYIYYDYPYYYSRGHYPTHIGGYVYYIPRATSRCADRHRRCVGKGGNHRGSASFRRQRGACRCS